MGGHEKKKRVGRKTTSHPGKRPEGVVDQKGKKERGWGKLSRGTWGGD